MFRLQIQIWRRSFKAHDFIKCYEDGFSEWALIEANKASKNVDQKRKAKENGLHLILPF